MNGKSNAESIFGQAIEIASPQDRAAFLNEACAADAPLRQEVEKLVRDHFQAGNFLERPAMAATADGPPLEGPGTQIGPYKLMEQVGEGGMGLVFVAEQHEPVRRKVALKVIKPGMDTRDCLARFEAERQALALMDHPNIARVLDAGSTASGRPYFVMELVKGTPITEYCDDNRLTPRERLELFTHVCHAVQHAHQKGIIHRDIKPTNVLVASHDGRPVVKVIDFGVAKAIGQQLTERTIYTALTQMVGTPLYMSPEQAGMSSLDIDTRSDIYSLGVLLYELLTGTTPFDKERLKQAAYDEMRRIIREEEPQKPSTRISTTDAAPSIAANRGTEPAKLTKLVRGELDWIVMKALEKDRSRRYETANGFALDVERYLADEPVLACPPAVGYRLRKFARRNKGLLAAAAAALLFLATIAGSIGWIVRDRDARQTRLAGQVELILDEVDRLAQDQKWPEALAAAKRAEPLLGTGDADEETQERVRQALADLQLVQRLEAARLVVSQETDPGIGWNHVGAEEAYASAFADAGFTIEGVTVREAADQLRRRSRVVTELAAALTHWSGVQKTIQRGSDDSSWQHLLSVADEIDPDPWRRRVREEWKAKDRDANALRELAESADLRTLPASTVVLLGKLLRDRISRDAAVIFLRKAQEHRPHDFWINFDLAVCLEDQDERIAFNRAADALLPHNPFVLSNLGLFLMNKGRLEEAIACLKNAIRIHPNNEFAFANLGSAYTRQGELDQAILFYHKAIALNPKHGGHYMGLGMALTEQNKLGEAIACYRKAIELDPKSDVAYNNFGIALVKQEKWDEAAACYQRSIELDPKSPIPHCNLADGLIKQGKLDEAIACCRRAIELDPKEARSRVGLGIALRRQNKPDEAIASYRKAIELDPKYVDAHMGLGDILREQKRLDEAIACFRKAVELAPGLAGPHHRLGAFLSDELHKYDEAIACFTKAVEFAPKDAKGHFGLGVAFREKGMLDAAITSFSKAIEVDPIDARNHYNLGVIFSMQNKLVEAIAAYRAAIEHDPKHAKAHYNLAIARRDQGELDEAIAGWRKYLELDPKHAPAHRELGAVLLAEDKLDQAVAAYREAVRLDPQFVEAHYELGIAFRKQRTLDDAIVCYRRAIELDSKFVAAHYDLGVVLCDLDKLDDAIASLKKAIELEPKDARGHWALGVALKKNGQTDDAIAAYREAIKLTPNYVAAHINLGTALLQQRKLEEAIVCFQQAIQLDPKHVQAYRNLGMTLNEQGKHEEAIAIYRKSIAIAPDDARMLNGLAWLLATSPEVKLRNPHEAVALARRAVQQDPKSWHYWNTLSIAAYRAEKWQESFEAREEAIRRNDQGGKMCWNGLGMAMIRWQLGQKEEARKAYERVADETNKFQKADLQAFRDEAAQLLGIAPAKPEENNPKE